MKTLVVLPMGAHPFHPGHLALYQSAQRAFPDAEVYVAATNDTSARPFPFPVKEKLAKLAGVEPGHFVQVKSPFRAEEITSQFDPQSDRLIFVRSEKDANKPPQAGGVKRDGSPSYLQPLLGARKLEPFARHAYMAYLPTVEFGPGMTSATQIREAWPTLDQRRKTALVMSLYPKTQGNAKLAATVVKLLDAAIGGSSDVAEAPDSKFVGFMNKTLGQKADAPADKSAMPDFMKDAPVAGLDAMGYKAALDFGMKTLNKLTPTQKTKLSTKGENGVVNWLESQARKQGLLVTDDDTDDQDENPTKTPNGKFSWEDLDEVQDFLPDVFKDPAITSWALVLTDGEPLPKEPVVGPFSVSINPGLPGQNGYANANWKELDTLENLPDAVELAKGLAQKNPKQFIAIWTANGKSAGFYWPGKGWSGLKEGVAESVEFMSDAQFYGELLSVLAAMGAGLATGAYLKARDIVKMYNADRIMRALEGYRVGNISDSERQALTKLIAEFKQAMAQRQGEQALAIAKQIKTIATDRTSVAEGWKDVVAGGAMALAAMGAGAQSMPNINAQQVELTNKYYKVLVQRAVEDGKTLDARTKNFLMAKAQDAAAQKIQKSTAQTVQTKPQQGFPTQGSERRVAKDAGQFESADVDENQGWAATLETVSATGTTANTSGAGAGMTASYQRRDNQPISEDYLSERRL